MSRRVQPSFFVIDTRGVEAQLQRAARLLWQGWDCESVAVQTGLSLTQVRVIAVTLESDGSTKGTLQL